MKSSEKELVCSLVPFLKWPGGKRWFVGRYADLLPEKYGTYIEPFLGAGSVYFHIKPKHALLGDANSELINAYRVIRDDWESLQDTLDHHQICHDEDAEGYYYWVRKHIPEEPFLRAARLIYLNRTCFNGIYRVNRQGVFNVPKGSKDKVLIETDDFRSMSRLLAGSELISGDFEPLIDRAVRGDFVFCDPPYTVRHNYNGFVKYNEVLFSWADQERLAATLLRAARRGVKVICTNANHQSVRDLYRSKKFKQIVVSRRSPISADSAGRRSYEELIVQANI